MVIVVGLVGGGAVGGLYVGQVDWDAYFSDSSHHIDYKTNSLGQIYSVIHTDPAQDEEKNDGYYVSMGSAPTRTKAEALYNHLKGWYDGDMAIKQW